MFLSSTLQFFTEGVVVDGEVVEVAGHGRGKKYVNARWTRVQ